MARPRQRKDIRLIHKISHLYYEQGLDLNAIAEKLQLSRTKVSRLLSAARDTGIIQIIVKSPSGVNTTLENQLEHKYNLQEAIVVEVSDPKSSNAVVHEIGVAAANYFSDTVWGESRIGVSWGTTLSSMVSSLQEKNSPDCHVIQIIGGLGSPTADVHVTDLCRRMAASRNCDLTLLPAPGIVGSVEAKQILLSDLYIKRAFELIPQLDMAFVGIGAPTQDAVLLRDGAIISQDEVNDLLSKGAVGDIALRFFDLEGNPIQSELDDRVIGITLEQLKSTNRVIGIAGGPDKLAAIRGALTGGFLSVLITDHITAKGLIGD